jgi:hypothetical protein
MSPVLFDRRIDRNGPTRCKCQTLAALVDLDAASEPLAFEDPKVKQAIEEQMVNLGDHTVMLYAKVMDDNPVRTSSKINIDMIGGLRFAHIATPNIGNLLFYLVANM